MARQRNDPITDPPHARTNAELPRGVQGGVIESVKRAVIVALKEGLNGGTLGQREHDEVSVEMEYPMTAEHYPGIWVQFSFTEFLRAGIGHELVNRRVEEEGTENEWINWEVIREIQFRGSVTLTLMALTSLERDRLADSVLTMLAYARTPEYVLTNPSRDTKQFRALIDAIAKNPYISMTIDHDTVTPGGQTVTPGVPWDEAILGYEDNYSFSILGQSNIVFRNDGTYTLRRVDVFGDLVEAPTPFEWQ